MSYAQWKLEQKHLKETGQRFPVERHNERPTDIGELFGYWRKIGARTKADTPVAIWQEKDRTLLKLGNQRDPADDAAVERFLQWDMPKCIAVTREEWAAALEAGKWADGKRIRLASPEEITRELAALIPSGHNSQGEDGVDLFHEQVSERLNAAMQEFRDLGKIDTMEKAQQVAEILEPARAVWKLGEDRRKAEKKPHDDAADAVQAKWVPTLLKPAADMFKWANDEAVAMGKREAARLQKIEADRLAEEARKRADEQRRQAEQMGMEAQAPTDEEIEAEAAAQAAQSAPAVRVGTAHGKALSAPKQAKAVITDPIKFFAAVQNDPNIRIALQKKADALARAKHTVEGMKIQ